MRKEFAPVVAGDLVKAYTTTMERGAGENHAQTLGKLAGRRISLVGNTLHLPNTTPGRALAALLTGQPATRGQSGVIKVDCHSMGGIGELLELLSAIDQATQTEPQETTVVSPVLQELLSFGIEGKVASGLAADPWVTGERITAWLEYIAYFAEDLTKPKGYLVTRLRSHVEAPHGEWSQPAPSEQTQQDPGDDQDSEPLPISTPSSLDEPLEESGRSPATIWQIAYEELRLQLPRETFDARLRRARLIAYDTTTSVMTIGVPDVYVQEWLEQRLRKVIERTVNQIAGQPTEVKFVVEGKTDIC